MAKTKTQPQSPTQPDTSSTAGVVAEARRLGLLDQDREALSLLEAARAGVKKRRGPELEERWLAFEMAASRFMLGEVDAALDLLSHSAKLEIALRILAFWDERFASIRREPRFLASVGARAAIDLPLEPKAREKRALIMTEQDVPMLTRALAAHGWNRRYPMVYAFSTGHGKETLDSEVTLEKKLYDGVLTHMHWFYGSVLTKNRDVTCIAATDQENVLHLIMQHHAASPYEELERAWDELGARIIHGVDYVARSSDHEKIEELLQIAFGACDNAALCAAVAAHENLAFDAMSVAEPVFAARGWDPLPELARLVEEDSSYGAIHPCCTLYLVEHRARLAEGGKPGKAFAAKLEGQRAKDKTLFFE